jgi:hypothetical protein
LNKPGVLMHITGKATTVRNASRMKRGLKRYSRRK